MLDAKVISVLVVDDDPLVLASTARFLTRRGMQTTCASSPFGVTARILKEAPDVVVLDCHMPGLDGAHLARLIRTSTRTAATRVVFYSGDSEANLVALARALDAQYACKGSGPLGLVDAIATAMRRPPAHSWSTSIAV